MALVVKDRVKESTTTSGTGTLTLAGAVTGFQSFAAALSDGDTTYYAIAEFSTGAWEVGLGTWATGSSTLARTTILDSSNSGSAINLSGAGADVFITQPADKAAYFDAAGDLTLNQDPTAALQAATKQYVDTIAAAGIHYHDPVRVEREGNLTATYNNGTAGVGATLTNSGTQAALVIDGVTLNSADRVLVYEQTDQTQNGVYTVTNTGSASTNWVLTRATDADSYGPSDPDSLGQGDAFFVQEGAAGAGETYVMNTEGTITFGTTNITFAQFSSAQIYSAGDGLTLTGVTFAAGAGTGVTVNANDIAIGQDVGTSADVTFNTVAADLTGSVTGNVTGNASTASALQTARDIALTGAVTGSTSFDGSGNVSITTTATSDPTITLAGDLSGSATLTNLGNATLTATITANSVALGTDTTGDYIAAVSAGTAIDISGSGGEGATATVNVDLSELSTSTTDGDGDYFVVVDTVNAQRKLTKGNINISGFNNDAGYSTTTGTVTSVATGGGLTGGTITSSGTLSHADTSSQGSVNNSGATVIQDVTLDTYGHVTGLGSHTLTLANLGYTGATNANYITNNNQLTNGAGYTTYTADQALNTGSAPTFAEVYNNGWFRNNQANEGLYNQATGNHWAASAQNIWVASNGSTSAKIELQTSGSTRRGSLYADSSNNVGLLDSDDQWAIKHIRDTRTEFFINNAEYMELNTSGLYLHDGSLREDYDALSGTSPTCNVNNGGAFSLTMTGNTTFTFSGADSGYSSGFILQVTGNGSTLTWPSSVDWAGGTAPDAPASGESNLYVFWSRDGGSNWVGVLSAAAYA